MHPAARDGTREPPLALLAAAGVLLAAWAGSALWERSHPPVSRDLVRWVALALAPERATGGRPILYYFTADWCVPCKRLRQEVFGSNERARYLNERFLPVKVVDRVREDGKNEPAVEELMKRYAVAAFPTLVVTGGPGTGAYKQEGYLGEKKTWEFLLRSERSFQRLLRPRGSVAGGAPTPPPAGSN